MSNKSSGDPTLACDGQTIPSMQKVLKSKPRAAPLRQRAAVQAPKSSGTGKPITHK
jgi:hypothetical protein